MIELFSAHLRAEIDESRGASFRSLDWAEDGQSWKPVFAAENQDNAHVFSSASFPMLPFANRARDNQLGSGAHKAKLRPNFTEPCAIHGTGWERPWTVTKSDAGSCELALDVNDEYPITFAAKMTIRLQESTAILALSVTNTAKVSLPFGLGLHPFFPHFPDTELAFSAQDFWVQGSDLLPKYSIKTPPEFDFETSRKLPATALDNCYQGWERECTIRQPQLGYVLDMTASEPLDHLMVFAPQNGRFAVEPQSHVSGNTDVDPLGLVLLESKQTLFAQVSFNLNPIH